MQRSPLCWPAPGRQRSRMNLKGGLFNSKSKGPLIYVCIRFIKMPSYIHCMNWWISSCINTCRCNCILMQYVFIWSMQYSENFQNWQIILNRNVINTFFYKKKNKKKTGGIRDAKGLQRPGVSGVLHLRWPLPVEQRRNGCRTVSMERH